MIRTRGRKILRDILALKARTVLVSLSIFVGVTGVVVLTTLGQLLTRQLKKDLNPSEMAMLRIYLDLPDEQPVNNAAVLDLLKQQPGVTDVEGQSVYQFQWKRPDETEYISGQLYAFSEPFRLINLEPIRLLEGRYPLTGRNEIALEQRMADAHHLKIGDTLHVRGGRFRPAVYTITGLIFQPYLYVGSNDATASAYVTYSDAQSIISFDGFSSIYVRFTDFATAREASREFRRVLSRETPYDIVFYLLDDPQENAFIVGAEQFRRVLFILGFVVMIVASFLVTNVINTMVVEQRRQIGAMKAIGATQWDVLVVYLGTALSYGVIGTAPALILGIFLGQQAAEAAAPLANTILETTSPPPGALLLGLALGLGIPFVAAFIPVYNASKITILEAMSDFGIESPYGRGPVAHFVGWLRLPINITQSLNSILSHKARLSLTILSLTLAAGAFMGMFAVFYRLSNAISDVRDRLDYSMSFDPGQLDVADVMQRLFREEEIAAVRPGVAVELAVGPLPEPQAEASAEDVQDPPHIFVTGIDPAIDQENLNIVDGTAWADDPAQQGIVITTAMAQQFEKSVGDTIELSSPDRTAAFEIIGIADYSLATAFMQWEQLDRFVGVVRDAPNPNAYWEPVQIQNGISEEVLQDQEIWAVGIDERVGQFLTPGFSVDEPGVIISQALAEVGGYEKGETITLQPKDGDGVGELIDGSARTYPILNVVAIDPQQLGLFTRNVPSQLETEDSLVIAMHWAELASLTGLDYREVTPRTLFIDVSNPVASLDAAAMTMPAPTAVYRNEVAFADRIAQTILSLGLITNVASLLMAVVGGIGLLTIMSINVFERQREIGVMRSVGATSVAIIKLFLLEGLLIGVTAWLVGLPLSYGLSRLLIASVPFTEVITYEYTPLAPVLGLILTLTVTIVSTLYPSIRAARKTVHEILQYQ